MPENDQNISEEEKEEKAFQNIVCEFAKQNEKDQSIEGIAEKYRKYLNNFVKESKKDGNFPNKFAGNLRFFHKLFCMAYYERFHNKSRIRGHSNPKPKTKSTIRINQIPFTEAMLIHIMAIEGEPEGINLEIVDVPWSDTYRALVDKRIDIALHDEVIDKVQRPLVPTQSHQYDLLRSDNPLYEYDGYYAIEALKKRTSNERRIAIIGDSEQNEVCKKYKEKKEWNNDNSSLYPVDDVFECFNALFEGEVDACIVGGYEKGFFENCVRNERQWPDTSQESDWVKDKITYPVKVYFWTLDTTQEEKLKADTAISLWNRTQKILNDDALALNKMKEEILCRLNQQLDIAFFVKFEKLWEILKKHKKPINEEKALFQSCDEMISKEERERVEQEKRRVEQEKGNRKWNRFFRSLFSRGST